MSYVLNAFVGDLDLLRRSHLPIVGLSQGKALVPLDGEFWRKLGGSSQPLLRDSDARRASDADFEDPSERSAHIEKAAASFALLTAFARTLSMAGPIVYLESEYWAGAGHEASAVWDHGALVLPALVAPDAVNRALRVLGVTAPDEEFTALGLGRFRSTDHWRKVATI